MMVASLAPTPQSQKRNKTPESVLRSFIATPNLAPTTVGKEALVKMWEKTNSREHANVTLKDLEPFVVHGHLLNEAQRGEVQKLTEMVLSKSEGKKGMAKTGPSKRTKGLGPL